ncbi:SDR family oxidoreductase [Sphingobacterium sp. 2149]|uniref:SDR family oxidoreductase n=1 Tax=Sphingobacterium sp. 2149 TaxID=2817763 RepID=UPI001AE66EE0|nr:SDR family oxidoreductase [Sphingobacterium sp. 2149]MDR6735232.1 NAD(P)H dehydrogenase (quinone) [Sphingobacterium sp. 2149]
MMLITGATGQFGGKAVEHLLNKGVQPSQITLLVRDAEKAKKFEAKGINIRIGDYQNEASLMMAMQDIDKLFLVSSNDKQAYENRTVHHKAVIDAAKQANVKHIFYTSFVRIPGYEQSAIAGFQQSHVDTEATLKDSGITYTILQNGIYFEMLPIFTGADVAKNGTILFPAGNGKASYVLREELAEAAAHVLTTEGHENKTYSLTNTTSFNFHDVAEAIGNTIDKDISYVSPDVAEYEAILKQANVPEAFAGVFSMWALAQAQGTMDVEDDTLEQFLGRKPTSLQQFINILYK